MNTKKEPKSDFRIPLQKRLLSIEEAVTYLGLGKSSAQKHMETIGAKRKIGRRVLYDKSIIDSHLDSSSNRDGGDGQ